MHSQNLEWPNTAINSSLSTGGEGRRRNMSFSAAQCAKNPLPHVAQSILADLPIIIKLTRRAKSSRDNGMT